MVQFCSKTARQCSKTCLRIRVFGCVSGAPNGSFRGISVRRFSDLIAVKARDSFRETSRRTFVTRGLMSSHCFQGDKYVVKSAK